MDRATRGDGLRPAIGQCQAMRSCRQIPVTRAEAIGGRKETQKRMGLIGYPLSSRR